MDKSAAFTRTGAAVTLFRIRFETARSGLAPLFHQALGLLNEYDEIAPVVRDEMTRSMAAKESGNDRDTATFLYGGLQSHFMMVQVAAAHAAIALIVYADNLVRESTQMCDKTVQEIRGGRVQNGVSLLEAFRATGDWARHHYDWTNENREHWPVQVLTRLGLDIADDVLPARLFKRFGFTTYASLEVSLVTGVRSMIQSWKLEA